jgi:hypothetical protein
MKSLSNEIKVLKLAEMVDDEPTAHAFVPNELSVEVAVLDRIGLVEGGALFGIVPTARLTDKGRTIMSALEEV